MNNHCILVENKKYRILEIEFYFFKKNVFEDCFTYKDERQKTNGCWFFHYSGVDITFGSKNTWGGILLRSLAAINNKGQISKVICGPLKLKNEMLNNFSSIFDTPATFKIEQLELTSQKLYMTPRIGLNPEREKKATGTNEFVQLECRYLIYPSSILLNKRYLKRDQRKILEGFIKKL